MTRGFLRSISIVCLMGAGLGTVAARPSPYEALGVETKSVLGGTVINSRVLPGEGKQVVALVTYMTGATAQGSEINVKLGVFDHVGERLVERYIRDVGSERGGFVANGELQLLDLDRDGVNEIVITYDTYADPLVDQRIGEIVIHEDGVGFTIGGSGAFEYDATRAARTVPAERRDRYVREIDFANTLRTRGITLFFHKRVIAVAGERLPEIKTVQETFPLRPKRERP